jgi:hypothetical protein
LADVLPIKLSSKVMTPTKADAFEETADLATMW